MSTETLKKPIIEGWTPYFQLTNEDKQVFDDATGNGEFLSADYIVYEVATEIVLGQHYRYRCEAFSTSSEKVLWKNVIIEIFKPLMTKPYITGLVKL